MGGRTAVAAAAVLGLLVLPTAHAVTGTTTRASGASGGTESNGYSLAPAVSGDGRIVAYYSDASNLVADDTNGLRDVFVYDRGSRTTTRVSVSGSGEQSNGQSFAPAVSYDGRYVAFHSHASNLVPGDANDADDVFVRDLAAGTTTRVSAGDAGSYFPSVSRDGGVVAYASDATNLVAGDGNRVRDIFVWARATGTTTRVSVSSTGAEANVGSDTPAVSADGRFVAFSSYATTLVDGDTNEGADIFVHDRLTGATSRVNMYDPVTEADGDSVRPAISFDGRYVAFESDAWNLVWGDTNFVFDVFVADRATGYVQRASLDDAGIEGGGPSRHASISANGRFVAFESESSNLASGDTNGGSDIFVADRQSGATSRVSLASSGTQGNEDSHRPVLSGDGSIVAFDSDASNLVAGDGNGFTDVFVRDPSVAAPPPPPPPPARRCVVPRVIGLRLATARTRIRRALCSVGRIRRARSRRVGRVIAQSPRAGTRRAVGAPVTLVVGRR